MKDETGKIILLIASDVVSIILTLLFYNFVMKNNIISNAKAEFIQNDGPTTILIYRQTDWKTVVLYFLFTTTINIIIVSIIKIIEYEKLITVPLKYKILIIIAFAILTLIFLFPGLGMTVKIKSGANAQTAAAVEDRSKYD